MLLSLFKKNFAGLIFTTYLYSGLIYLKVAIIETVVQNVVFFITMIPLTIIVVGFFITIISQYKEMKNAEIIEREIEVDTEIMSFTSPRK